MRRALDRLLAAPPPRVDHSLYLGTPRAARLLAELAGRPRDLEALAAIG
jgi:hypothetical protein